MQEPLISIRNLTYRRGEHVIFDNLSLEIMRGQITAVMGPSGSGKTTLLQCMGGTLLPDGGQITIDGKDIHTLSQTARLEMRKKMGMLFQNGALFTDLDVFDNVAFPIREHTQLAESLIKDIVLMKLEAVGLRGAATLMPSELSGGMSRRVALARAIALDPMLMMYDEPFTGQDPVSLGVLARLIKRLNQLLGLTSILVSHDVEETCAIADYVYLIAEGRCLGHGTPEALLHSSNPDIRQFLYGFQEGSAPFHYPAPKTYIEELLDV